jgi:hypothetical protein
MSNPLRYLYKKLSGTRHGARRAAAQPIYPPAWRHAMAVRPYRPEFYAVGNIIGYAGSITANPTVFFQDGTRYGHIVASDPDPDNVGREIVDDYSEVAGTGYRIANERSNGQEVAVERFIYSTGVLSPPIYTYRDRFIDFRTMPQALRGTALPLLAQIIRGIPMKKPRWEGRAEIIPPQ